MKEAFVGSRSAIAAVGLLLVFPVALSRADCGVERWPAKTLQDPDAKKIDFRPLPASVTRLRTIATPGNLRSVSLSVRFPAETHVYSVRAMIVGLKKEGDRDYHLVIAEPSDLRITMIAEIPEPSCANPKFASLFIVCRKQVDSLHTPSSKFYKLKKPVSVVVTGVFFFDFVHGQNGVSKNGAELHPVLKITTP